MNRSEERKAKIKAWLKNPYNLAFIGIIVLAFVLRLYYFFLTKTQPLWWDEAEYALKAKSFAFGTPATGWAAEREILVPLLFSFIFRLGLGEIAIRFVQLLVSLATVFMTYIVISKLTSKRIALMATFGMAFFWLHIFFTQRILLYLWAPLAYLLIAYFFYTGYVQGNKRDLIIFAIVAGIGLQLYFSVGFLLFGLAIYALSIEGFSLFKNKKAWLSLFIFFLTLAPYMIYSQITYGFPIPRLAVGYRATTQEVGAGIAGLLGYVSMFPSRIGLPFTLLLILGLAYFIYNLILGFGIKNYLKEHKNWLLTFICFFIPLTMYTLYGTIGGNATFYDAFILPVFPFAFAFSGLAIDKVYEYIKKNNKIIAIAFIAIFLLWHAYSGIQNSDTTIKNKLTSYDSVKYAGLWIKENSNKSDVVISTSLPQNTYYSERLTYSPNFFDNSSSFKENMSMSGVQAKFWIVSVWESTKDWVYLYPQQNNLTAVQAYFLDQEKTKPSLVIYQIKD